MKHLTVLLAFALAAWSQAPKPGVIVGGNSSGGGGGGTYTAGTGLTLAGDEFSINSAVTQTKANDQSGATRWCLGTGTAGAQTCSLSPVLTAYTTGMTINYSPGTTNVTTQTLNIDTLGVKSILSATAGALAAGDLTAGRWYPLLYDGTQWRLTGSAAAPSSSGGYSYWTTATSANVSSTVRTVTGATAASPVEITATAHGFATGTRVWVTGVGGITGINDQLWVVTNTGTNTFTLDGSTGTGSYTSGGTAAGSGTQVFTMLGRSFTSTRAAAEIKAPATQTVTYMSLRTGPSVTQGAQGPMICSLWVAGARSSLSVTVPASTATSTQVTPGTGSVSITQGDNVTIGCENFASSPGTDAFYIALF